jgi:16S rRNA (cytosine1407-C5)-methyltransferase
LAFDHFYSSLWSERWTALRSALLESAHSVEFGGGEGAASGCTLLKPYFLDAGSVEAARTLRLPPGEKSTNDTNDTNIKILDACAAPGGKTLVLACRAAAELAPGTFTLQANELSDARRARLAANLDEHLSPELRSQVTVTPFDAAKMASRENLRGTFDAILLDAPCSSERHVLASSEHLARWTPARPRQLAQRQWALLSACFLLLKAGGSLVYATCSINPGENDGVAARLPRKYKDAVPDKLDIDKPSIDGAEETEYGVMLLPDKTASGPMYISRWMKKF